MWTDIYYFILCTRLGSLQDGLYSVGKPLSARGVPAEGVSGYDNNDTNAVESPRSAVPSPLLAASTVHNQHAADATMPTLR